MDRFLREMPEGRRLHARVSAPTVEESPGGFDDRGLEDGQLERLELKSGQLKSAQLDKLEHYTVDRQMARLFRDQVGLILGDGCPATAGRVSSTVSPVLPVRGRTLGRYLLLGELGSGGMGTVLKAYDESLDRVVAIKLLHSEAAERYTERLRREAQALAKLSHPNVVQVYEVGQHDGQWFIAMELVSGKTLRQWQQTPRGWRECVETYLQVGAGLIAAHRAGLVHRDFKPDNCIVDRVGRPRVLDFGLVGGDAEPVLDVTSEEIEVIGLGGGALESSLTESGAVLGTPAYMPPEQMRGEGADARSDQFSFCVS
ncbi:MAG: serine/threonine-protein kinase, partial [Myxococcota bacterium]